MVKIKLWESSWSQEEWLDQIKVEWEKLEWDIYQILRVGKYCSFFNLIKMFNVVISNLFSIGLKHVLLILLFQMLLLSVMTIDHWRLTTILRHPCILLQSPCKIIDFWRGLQSQTSFFSNFFKSPPPTKNSWIHPCSWLQGYQGDWRGRQG